MEWLWKAFLVIVALPFFFMGLSMVMQIIFGSGLGLLSFFAMIWNKKERLTAKQGFVFGIVYLVVQMLIVFIFGLFVSYVCGLPAITDGLNHILSLIPLGVLLTSLMRGKYAFGFSFFLVNQILVIILRIF